MHEDKQQKEKEKLKVSESELHEELASVFVPVSKHEPANVVKADGNRNYVPPIHETDLFNSKLDLSSRGLLFVLMVGTTAFGSWIVSSTSVAAAVTTFVVGCLLMFSIARLSGRRFEDLFAKNPVGMKFVVALVGLGVFLIAWILVRVIFVLLGLPVEK